MKNKLKFFKLIAFVAMIGISTTAYSDDVVNVIVNNTNGSLTISGFPSTYYGKWIFAEATNEPFLAALNVSSDLTLTLGQISNSGSVTLKIWKTDWGKYPEELIFNNYNGSDTLNIVFAILNTSTFLLGTDRYIFLAYGDLTATFNNGTGSGKIGNIIEAD